MGQEFDRLDPNHPTKKSQALIIYETYVQIGSIMELNLGSKTRQAMKEKFEGDSFFVSHLRTNSSSSLGPTLGLDVRKSIKPSSPSSSSPSDTATTSYSSSNSSH